jgi:hypothetical protein
MALTTASFSASLTVWLQSVKRRRSGTNLQLHFWMTQVKTHHVFVNNVNGVPDGYGDRDDTV